MGEKTLSCATIHTLKSLLKPSYFSRTLRDCCCFADNFNFEKGWFLQPLLLLIREKCESLSLLLSFGPNCTTFLQIEVSVNVYKCIFYILPTENYRRTCVPGWIAINSKLSSVPPPTFPTAALTHMTNH